MTPAELCERVVERLETSGWTQGTVGPQGGPNCVLGALLWEETDLNSILVFGPAQTAARRALSRFIGSDNIAAWNDNGLRTEFEVIDAVKTVGKMFANGEITMDPA